MKNFIKVLFVLYVIALTCSMAAMEIAGWGASISFCAWWLWGTKNKKITIKWKPVGVEITCLVFSLIVLIGLLINDQDSDLLYSFGRIRNLLLIFSLPMILQLFDKKQKLIEVILGCATVIAVYGIWQHFTGIDLWRHNHRALMPVPWGDHTGYSTVGLFNHHLTYGHSYVMILCIPWAGLLLDRGATWLRKSYYLTSAAIIGVSLIFTYGRGVWIAALIALPIMALLVSKRLVMVILSLFVLGSLLLCKIDPFFSERAKSIFSENYRSNAERKVLWQANMEMFRDHPWIGVGYQQNEKLVASYYKNMPGVGDALIGHAHNNYIQMLATTGILGFFCYMSFIALFLIMTLQLYQRIPKDQVWDKVMVLAALGAQVAFHVGGLTQFNFGDMKVMHQFIFWLALVAGLRYKYNLAAPEWDFIKNTWRKMSLFFADDYFKAVCIVAFTVVFIKKWEPGGNIDTVWYSAIAKNIYLTGDFFHFTISKYYFKDIFDHMPMTYWITAWVFKIMGPSDFAARLYPMICSFISYILVFRIGTMIKDKVYGLAAIVMYILCFGATKWNGALMHDVPLTMYYLASFYCFLRAFKKPKLFYLATMFFAFGVFTKGPIIFGLPLGIFSWALTQKQYSFLKERHFYYSLVTMMTLFMVPLLPALQFDGLNMYTMFLMWKSSYLTTTYWYRYLAYFVLVLQMASVPVLAAVLTPIILARTNFRGISENGLQIIKLCAFVSASIIVPLSFFIIKYPHYLLPFYPFFSLIAAYPLYLLVTSYKIPLAKITQRLSLLFLCLFVALPIKTAGTRSKDLLNLVNIIKLDQNIKSKDVVFLGRYVNDMSIFQTFKFYGSIDLKPLWPYQLDTLEMDKTFLVLDRKKLPIKVKSAVYDFAQCLVYNDYYCVLTNPSKANFKMPLLKYPQELY